MDVSVMHLKKAIRCLALEFPESVHRDVEDKADAVYTYIEGLKQTIASNDKAFESLKDDIQS